MHYITYERLLESLELLERQTRGKPFYPNNEQSLVMTATWKDLNEVDDLWSARYVRVDGRLERLVLPD